MPELNPGGAAGLNDAIKARYEANADTNAFTDAEKTKLSGIATAATANAADAALRDRSTHTGTQAASTISGTKTSSFISDFAAAVAALITGKQDTLVSGTSLKTVNGTSLLGSGDVAVSGGSGSPGGASGEVQFNSGGSFAGAADVEIEGGQLRLPAIATPAAPAAGGVKLFGRAVAGRTMPAFIGPSGLDTRLQPILSNNSLFYISPTSGTAAPNVIGGTLTTAATMSLQQTFASSNRWLGTSRKRFQTSTTAGNATGMRTAYRQWYRGGSAGFGGFYFQAQFGSSINLNGGQFFIGLADNTNALAGDPSTSFALNMCGMGYDAADTGNWQFFRNDGSGSPVKVDLGEARGVNIGYDLTMFLAQGGSELFVRIVNLNTDAVILDTSYTTDIPAANTGMCFHADIRNGAVAAAANIEVAKVYIEADY